MDKKRNRTCNYPLIKSWNLQKRQDLVCPKELALRTYKLTKAESGLTLFDIFVVKIPGILVFQVIIWVSATPIENGFLLEWSRNNPWRIGFFKYFNNRICIDHCVLSPCDQCCMTQGMLVRQRFLRGWREAVCSEDVVWLRLINHYFALFLFLPCSVGPRKFT